MNLQKNIRRILEEAIDKSNGWEESSGKLTNKYKFSNYDDTIEFVNKVAKIAEKQNHHPDITFGYDYVKVSITDHEKGGVSDKCRKFVKEVNKL